MARAFGYTRRGAGFRACRTNPCADNPLRPVTCAPFYLALRAALRFRIPLRPLAPTCWRDQAAIVSPQRVQGDCAKFLSVRRRGCTFNALTPRPQRRRAAAHFRRLHGSEVAAVKRCLVARIKQKQLVAGEHVAQLPTCRTCDHCCRHLTLGQRLLRQRRRRRCRYIRARGNDPNLLQQRYRPLADCRAPRQGKPLNVESVPPRNRQAKV